MKQLEKQIKLLLHANSICLAIRNIVTNSEASALEMGKVDFYIQKLTTKLYTIDAIYITLKDNPEAKASPLYSQYIEQVNNLIRDYEELKAILHQTKEKLGKKLFWQDLFISNVFGKEEQKKTKLHCTNQA